MTTKLLPLLAGLGLATASVMACTTTTTYVTSGNDGGTKGQDGGGGGGGGGGDNDPAANSEACKTSCTRSTAAGCASPTNDECIEQCEDLLNKTPATCRDKANAFVSCAQTADYTCNDDGEATTADCDAELTAFVSCLQNPPPDPNNPDPNNPPPASACYEPSDAFMPGYTSVYPANTCTNAQVDAIINGCFGSSGSDSACESATTAAGAACTSCISGQNSKNVPAFTTVDNSGNGYISILGCAAVATQHPECAAPWTNFFTCANTACATCSESESDACLQAAQMTAGGPCTSLLTENCVTVLNGLTNADTAPCVGSDGIESLKKSAKQLCVVGAN